MKNLQTPLTHTTNPTITGGTVIGLKFKNGVILASDTQLNYGGFHTEKNRPRIFKVSDTCAIASGGEYSDFGEVMKKLEAKHEEDLIAEDGFEFLTPRDYCTWLSSVHYQRRNKGDPYWNNHIVGGYHRGEAFLGSVDMHGNTIQCNDYLVTGLAHYFCNVLLTNAGKPQTLSEQDAKKVLEDCFRVLFYRDCGMSDRIQFCTITEEGVNIEDSYVLDSKWDFKSFKDQTNEVTRDIRFYF